VLFTLLAACVAVAIVSESLLIVIDVAIASFVVEGCCAESAFSGAEVTPTEQGLAA
jgi:hypothetical protein